jgi:hypothetical protein
VLELGGGEEERRREEKRRGEEEAPAVYAALELTAANGVWGGGA